MTVSCPFFDSYSNQFILYRGNHTTANVDEWGEVAIATLDASMIIVHYPLMLILSVSICIYGGVGLCLLA